jgi:hypothetical protein
LNLNIWLPSWICIDECVRRIHFVQKTTAFMQRLLVHCHNTSQLQMSENKTRHVAFQERHGKTWKNKEPEIYNEIYIYIYYIYFRFCVIIRIQQVNTRIEHRLVYWWLWWIYSKLDSTLWSTSFSITGHSWKVLTAKRLGPKRSHQGSAHLFVPSATCLSPACILEGLIREWPGQIDRIGKRIEIFADNFWVSHIPGLIHN